MLGASYSASLLADETLGGMIYFSPTTIEYDATFKFMDSCSNTVYPLEIPEILDK